MRKTLDAYQAVFFDAGDTLLTIPETHVILHQYLSEQNIRADHRDLELTLHEAIQRFYYEKEIDASATCSPESDRGFWIEIYEDVLMRLGLRKTLTAERIHELCHEMYDIFTDPMHYKLFSDVKEVLELLYKRGMRLGLVSNFALTLRDILEVNEIVHYFDPVIISTEVGLEKPNPAIFQLALERSGLKAEHVLYVGDHEINDIWAPNQVGIDAVRLLRYPYQEGGDIRSLHELMTI